MKFVYKIIVLQNRRDEIGFARSSINLGGSTFSFSDFNAISFNNFFANTVDKGRVISWNNVRLGNGYSISAEIITVGPNANSISLSYGLIAGGNIFWGSGEL